MKKRKTNTGSNKRLFGALALVALVAIGALAYMATRPSGGLPAVDPNAPPVQAEGYLLGDPNAPVQVLEWADFECPSCAQYATVTAPDVKRRLVETGQISYRLFDFPLPQHRNSIPASNAAACANDQGKFWEMHDRIFYGQNEWNTHATSNPKKFFRQYAQEIGLNVDAWDECYDSGRHLRRIEANRREGERRMVNSTPTFFFGNKMVAGNMGYDQFKAQVDSALARAGASAGATTGAAPAGAATNTGAPAGPR